MSVSETSVGARGGVAFSNPSVETAEREREFADSEFGEEDEGVGVAPRREGFRDTRGQG